MGFLIFFLCVGASVAFIVLFGAISMQKSEIKNLKQQINQLWYRINSLNKGEPEGSLKQYPQQHYPPVPQAPPAPPVPQAPGVPPAPPDRRPVFTDAPPPQVRTVPKPEPPPKARGLNIMENWVGRNVLGIAASVLVFVGLIFLGVLIYRHITDEIKIALMFIISALITGLGIFLCRKKRNSFTLILTGCGCGSFFISVMLTHIYFERLQDIAAFSILLVWTAAVLLLAGRLESISLSVVAHIGMILSVCFAYALGLSDQKLVLLLVYQLASAAVIGGGNILCCKKTYRFGIFISLALTLIASGFMWDHFTSYPAGFEAGYARFAGTELPLQVIAGAFILQFLCASFLSYLLSVSTVRLKNERAGSLVHFANKVLWIVSFFMNIFRLVYRLTYAPTESNGFLTAIFYTVITGFAVLIIHACITIILSLKLNFSGRLETVSVTLLSAVGSLLMIVLWFAQLQSKIELPVLSLLILPAALMLLAKKVSRNKAYLTAANIIFGADLFFMLIHGYSELTDFGTIGLSAGYILIYLAVIWGQWLRMNREDRKKHSVTARLISYLLTEGSLAVIFLTSKLEYKGVILLLILTALNILLFLFRFDGRSRSVLYGTMRANEIILILLSAGCAAFAPKDAVSEILYLLLAALALGLGFVRIKESLFESGISFAEEGLYIFKIIILGAAAAYGYSSASYRSAVVLLTLTGLGILIHVLRLLLYRRHKSSITESPADSVLRASEAVLFAANALFIAYSSKDSVSNILCLILTALAAGLAFMRAGDLFRGRLHSAEEVLTGIKLTGLVLAAVYGHTAWFENTYIFSLICMLTALACVIAGFPGRSKPLRMYGLVLTLICVIKLVTYDVAGLTTLLRVVTLIGGGIICFIISAIYSYTVKKLDAEREE